MSRLVLRSGGQTGVDRAALDVALERGMDYSGWCPKGGWAEDCPDPPGVMDRYPGLAATAERDPTERTERNVRDADATLIVMPGGREVESPGSANTVRAARRMGRKCLVLDLDIGDPVARCAAWISGLLEGSGEVLELNVAGPRESESPGAYAATTTVLRRVLDRIDQRHPDEHHARPASADSVLDGSSI